jgi:hypothetical protein
VAGKPYPPDFVVGLGMKSKFAAQAVYATEDSEHVEGYQFNSFKTAIRVFLPHKLD